MRSRILSIATLAALASGLAACGDARPIQAGQDQGGGGGGSICTACHGGLDNQTGAPPYDTHHDSDPTLASVGAHTSHVGSGTGLATTTALPFDCGQCHVKPTSVDSPGHIDNNVTVPFPTGSLALTGGATPRWDPTTASCSNVYCHGTFPGGNTANAPVWTKVGQGQAACGTCHGLPPPAAGGHPDLTGTTVGCNGCHPGTVNADGTLNVAGGLHVNGKVDEGAHPDPDWFVDPTTNPTFTPAGGNHGHAANAASSSAGFAATCRQCHGATLDGGISGVSCNACHTSYGFSSWQTTCTFCHGTAGRTGNVSGTDLQLAASPPLGAQGETLTTDLAVGAHQSHVNPPATGALASPFACVECHASPLPTDTTHVNGVAEVPLAGTLATTGGVAPSWSASAASCSATYCHGNFLGGNGATPTWTLVDGTQAACTVCHGQPDTGNGIAPQTGQHPSVPGVTHQALGFRNSCQYCHSDASATSASATPTIANPLLHVNGVKDVGYPASAPGPLFLGTPIVFTFTPGATAGTGSCSSVSCHGGTTESW